MARGSNLHAAKRAKNDEFYTRLEDIENELRHYKDHFRDKVVYLNCDDYVFDKESYDEGDISEIDDSKTSQFWIFFRQKFDDYGLNKLIATHYSEDHRSYKVEMVNSTDHPSITPLRGNGDFRNEESIEVLKEADIVVTNPPFSLFREYVAQLIEYEKDFLIIGSDNAVTYKEIFPLIKDNEMWLGVTKAKQFLQPDGTYKKFGNIGWYTNLYHDQRNEPLFLYKEYSDELYPKYDNYDAINVDKTNHIPEDYYGDMGVPITFLAKYNPDQFEIVNANDLIIDNKAPIKSHQLIKDKDGVVGGVTKYARIVIKRKDS